MSFGIFQNLGFCSKYLEVFFCLSVFWILKFSFDFCLTFWSFFDKAFCLVELKWELDQELWIGKTLWRLGDFQKICNGKGEEEVKILKNHVTDVPFKGNSKKVWKISEGWIKIEEIFPKSFLFLTMYLTLQTPDLENLKNLMATIKK